MVPEKSGPCRSPSAGTGRNPSAPNCPGSTACRRTSPPPSAQLWPRSPASKTARTRALRSKRSPADGQGASRCSRLVFSHDPAAMGTSAGSLIRQNSEPDGLIWLNGQSFLEAGAHPLASQSLRAAKTFKEDNGYPLMHAVVLGRSTRGVSPQLRILPHLIRREDLRRFEMVFEVRVAEFSLGHADFHGRVLQRV